MFMTILLKMCVQNFMMIGYAWKSNKHQTHFHIYIVALSFLLKYRQQAKSVIRMFLPFVWLVLKSSYFIVDDVLVKKKALEGVILYFFEWDGGE